MAEALFGDINPGGRLPVTFYTSATQLPAFEDYAMEGRTYRYFRETPLYPFGFGLSYTRFTYSDLQAKTVFNQGEPGLEISVLVTNAGGRDGDEVVQLYLQDVEASVPIPVCELKRFIRLSLARGESRLVQFSLPASELACFDDEGQPFFEAGRFKIWAGGHSPALYGSVVEMDPLLVEEVILK